jgi:hypothetical protein
MFQTLLQRDDPTSFFHSTHNICESDSNGFDDSVPFSDMHSCRVNLKQKKQYQRLSAFAENNHVSTNLHP